MERIVESMIRGRKVRMGVLELRKNERVFGKATYNCVHGGSFTHLNADWEGWSKAKAQCNQFLRVTDHPVSIVLLWW